MNKGTYSIIIIIILLVAGGAVIYQRSGQGNDQGVKPTDTTSPENEIAPSTQPIENPTGEENTVTPKQGEGATPEEEKEEYIVTNTDSGFSPMTITIKIGESITFKNESSQAVWPASALHPTHTVYPGSDIKKCGTAEESSIFDACKGIEKGEKWAFIFSSPGMWKYHDHLNPSHFGTIIVK